MIGPAGTTAPVAGTVDTTCGAVGFAASPEATCVAPRIATVVIADIITGIPHQPGKRDNRRASSEKDQCVRVRAKMFEKNSDRDEDEERIER